MSTEQQPANGPRYASVAIIGRPSAGKSTLLNQLCGGKVAIVSPVPQTTRNKVRGIVTRAEGQIVFIDTPGLHGSDKKLNQLLRGLVTSSLAEVDLVLYVVDVSRRIGEEERAVIDLISRFSGGVVVALNKIDIKPNFLAEASRVVSDAGLEGTRVSAVQGQGVDEILRRLFSLAAPGDPAYPDDYYTDQDVEFRISEIIREKVFQKTRQEVPHATYIEIADIERQEDGGIWVRAFVCVERESQKGIVIGHGAALIKAIRAESKKDLDEIFPYPVRLDLRVKVRPRWRRKDELLRRMIR